MEAEMSLFWNSKLPDRELDQQQYYEVANARVTEIITAITEGRRRMANDLNVLSGLDKDVMNPPTAWAEIIMNLLVQYVDQVKSQYYESGNDILWYKFNFRLRTSGGRSTILFSF